MLNAAGYDASSYDGGKTWMTLSEELGGAFFNG